MKTTLTALALAIALPIAAQTTTTKPPVHHTTTTASATHRTVAGHCSVTLPVLSAKIPALPPTASKCPSVEYQLSYIDTKIGEGELATSKKWYTVHYTGYLPDGTKFDSSVDRGEPITFPYGAHRVIAGWDTGFEGMHVGGKRRLFVPYQLAYGEDGHPPVIPARATLIFDVELISQSATPPAPKTPPAPPAAPAGAKPATPPAGAVPPSSPAPEAKPSNATPAPGSAPATAPAPAPSGAPTTTPPSTTPPSKPQQ